MSRWKIFIISYKHHGTKFLLKKINLLNAYLDMKFINSLLIHY